MDAEALKQILEDMNGRRVVLPELKAGKLYWVRPDDEVISIGLDTKTGLVGYTIRQFKPEQKHSHYLTIISEEQTKPLKTSTGQSLPLRTKEYYSFDIPVMVLKDNRKEETEYVDLLVLDKIFKNVVFDPFNAGWKLIPVTEADQDDVENIQQQP